MQRTNMGFFLLFQCLKLLISLFVITDKLPFLDVDVSIKDGNLETSVLRKGTHTGVFMNFAAMAPQKWKFGLIFCMLHRAYAIC